MTKLDFSAVKDARVGSTEVQKIYRGNNKVWHRYCWEKWNCAISYIRSIAQSPVGDPSEILGTSGASNWYKNLTRKNLTYVLSGKSGSGYTVETAYTAGYKYMNITGTSTTLDVGDHFVKMIKLVENDGKTYARVQEYEVVSRICMVLRGYGKF